ncbi:sigma-70 family RNA polymerase sigma factor [Mycobacterium sp. HNNTM2301]|uniref:sigma-70 family RNA polymerase sigma factor n=1 Tax=Mycobacterium hainanense TaxID=3289775 RepID=UPI0035A6A16E
MTPADPCPPGTADPAVTARRFESDVVALMPALHSHAMRLTRNPADAEDLLQDTMLKAFNSFHTFQPATNIRAWLYRIQTNSYISSYRRQLRKPAVPLTEQNMDARPGSCHVRAAEDEALDALANADLACAMRALPQTFRTVVYYADVEGLPLKQIAELTKSPAGTVMSRLHRGRRRLRTLLPQGLPS